MIRAILAVTLSMMLGVACESSLDESQAVSSMQGIVGGEETNYESWKGVIAVVPGGGVPGMTCTGTLIAADVVLTAAHCVHLDAASINFLDKPASLLVMGGTDIYNSQYVYYSTVAKILIPPDWDGSGFGTDLALLRLNTSVSTVDHFELTDDEPQTGEGAKIVGYGLFSSSDQNSGGKHRVGDTTVLKVEDGLIEMGDPNNGCKGDSGGPLFTAKGDQWVLTGVISRGTNVECSPTEGGICTNVFDNLDWIEQAREELFAPDTGAEEEDTLTDGEDTQTEDTQDTNSSFNDDSDSNLDSDQADHEESHDSDDGCDCGQAAGRPNVHGLMSVFLHLL